MEHLSLLVSDVDNTLLGDDEALKRFSDWFDGERQRLRLAYSSGRFYDSVSQSVAESPLPVPDAIIGGVGTDIRIPPSGDRLESWPQTSNGWDAEGVRAVLTAHKELEPQADEFQSPYKISFYGYDLDDDFLAHLRRQFADLGYKVNIVYSSARDLDVLPANTNKGTAAAHLAGHLGISPTRVMVSGDSGNDLTMFQQGFLGIVVGNAHDELKALSGSNVYHATGEYASGVLEGLKYWLDSR